MVDIRRGNPRIHIFNKCLGESYIWEHLESIDLWERDLIILYESDIVNYNKQTQMLQMLSKKWYSKITKLRIPSLKDTIK